MVKWFSHRQFGLPGTALMCGAGFFYFKHFTYKGKTYEKSVVKHYLGYVYSFQF